jgi:hypothetical protein
MKKTLATTLAAAVLFNVSVASAAKVTETQVRSNLGKEVVIVKEAQIRAKANGIAILEARLVKAGGSKSSLSTSAIDKQLMTVIDGKEQNVSVLELVDSVSRAYEVLDNTRDLDAKADVLKKDLIAVLQTGAVNIPYLTGKIAQLGSRDAQAVAKILLMFGKIARGELSVEEANSYKVIVEGMRQALESGEASTAEEALKIALKKYDSKIDVAKKIDEILGCRI